MNTRRRTNVGHDVSQVSKYHHSLVMENDWHLAPPHLYGAPMQGINWLSRVKRLPKNTLNIIYQSITAYETVLNMD